jgi:hypothetical protein
VRAQSLQSEKFQVNIGMFICNKYNKLKCYVIVSGRLSTYDFNTVYLLRSRNIVAVTYRGLRNIGIFCYQLYLLYYD